MSVSDMNKPSETDWKRVNEMTDEEIDTSDIPPLDEDFFSQAQLRMPKRPPVMMKVDADLVDWVKAQGEGYENLINAALRSYVEGHKEEHR